MGCVRVGVEKVLLGVAMGVAGVVGTMWFEVVVR